MTEFRVKSDHQFERRERAVRLVLWGAVVVLAGIALFAVYGRESASPVLLTWMVGLTVLLLAGSVVGANVFAYELGIDKLRRGLAFEMNEKELVRKSTDWPDARIVLSEICALQEGRAGLLVASDNPPGKIAIPKAVDGYEELRTELAKHCSITVMPRRLALPFGPLLISLFCWALVLWSKNLGVVEVAAAIALIIATWEAFRLMRSASGAPKKHLIWTLVWMALGINWVAAILVVYSRAKHGL